VDGRQLTRQYKEHFGGFREWDQLDHAAQWVLFPKNVGPYLSMDETALSADELYTIVTNKEGHGRKGTLVAMIRGTKSEDVIAVLKKLNRWVRETVREITVDLSPTMMLIAREVFTKAEIVNDRFHVQQLMTEAMTAIRMECKREAQDVENATKMLCKEIGKEYKPFVCRNGDTLKQLFARSNRLIMKNQSKWTQTQKERAELLFRYSPRLEHAYGLYMGLTAIFNNCTGVDTALDAIDKWIQKVKRAQEKVFDSVVDTIKANIDTIVNYFEARSTNASAESFNAKVKIFRAQLKGVCDIPFFIFRLKNLFA
jgi:transposase